VKLVETDAIADRGAFDDYDGHRRELYRSTVAGERPV